MEQCLGLGSERQGMTALPLHLVAYIETTADPPRSGVLAPAGRKSAGGDPSDLGVRGDPGLHQHLAVLGQRPHPFAGGFLGQGPGPGPGHDVGSKILVDRQQFVHPVPTAVPGVPAFPAPSSFIRGFGPAGGLAAGQAKSANQPLGQDGFQAGGHQKRFHAHVQQTRGGPNGGVGVQGRKNQVPGERRLHRGFGGFPITDFPNHHHVGVVPKDGPQTRSKVEPHPAVHRNLVHAFHVVLHRIFHGDAFDLVGDDAGQRGVQRRRFARTGGARHQQDAIRAFDGNIPRLDGGLVHAEFLEVLDGRRLVEHPQDHAFPVQHGNDRDPPVVLGTVVFEGDASVLGPSFLADFEVRHDFQAAGDGVAEAVHHRIDPRLAEHAVDAVANDQAVFVGFDVDVGRALADAFEQDRVDKTHHAGIAGGVVGVGQGRVAAIDDDFVVEAKGFEGVAGHAVVAALESANFVFGGDPEFHVAAGMEADGFLGVEVGRVVDGDQGAAGFEFAKGGARLGKDDFAGERVEGLAGGGGLLQVDHFHVESRAEGFGEGEAIGKAHANDCRRQGLAGAGGLFADPFCLVGFEQAALDGEIEQRHRSDSTAESFKPCVLRQGDAGILPTPLTMTFHSSSGGMACF